jgi:hypothetical protein
MEEERQQLERLENIVEGLSDNLSWASEKEDLLDLINDVPNKNNTKKVKTNALHTPKQTKLFKFYPNFSINK